MYKDTKKSKINLRTKSDIIEHSVKVSPRKRYNSLKSTKESEERKFTSHKIDIMPSELSMFLSALNYHKREKKSIRNALWNSFDTNRNGELSFSEVDAGLRNHLNTKTKSSEV